MNELIRIDDALLGEIDIYTGENMITDMFSKASKNIVDSFTKLTNTFTFNITEFFDDMLYTGIPKKLNNVYRNLDELDKIDFRYIKDVEIVVTPGYEKRIDLIAQFVHNNIFRDITDSKKVFDKYITDLSLFITNRDKRNIKLFNKSYYKGIEEKQFNQYDSIKKLLNSNTNGETTIKELVGNTNGYKTATITLREVFRKGVDEKDLKVLLKDIRELKKSVNSVIEIIETENVSEAAIDSLISMNTIVANQYTLLSKLYHMLFETAQIIINNKDIMFGKVSYKGESYTPSNLSTLIKQGYLDEEKDEFMNRLHSMLVAGKYNSILNRLNKIKQDNIVISDSKFKQHQDDLIDVEKIISGQYIKITNSNLKQEFDKNLPIAVDIIDDFMEEINYSHVIPFKQKYLFYQTEKLNNIYSILAVSSNSKKIKDLYIDANDINESVEAIHSVFNNKKHLRTTTDLGVILVNLSSYIDRGYKLTKKDKMARDNFLKFKIELDKAVNYIFIFYKALFGIGENICDTVDMVNS